MKTHVPQLLLIFISLFLFFTSLFACYFIAQKFFFDKFFYQKSVTFGYWIPSARSSLSLKDFGDRARDIYQLENKIPDKNYPTELFQIAIYGDSYVWGQGIKNDQRFAKILEEKLNQHRPTRVISLAEIGDNIFDHYQKYQQAADIFGKIDLHIFALLFNDLLFDNPIDNRYQTKTFLSHNSYFGCTGPEFIATFEEGQNTLDSLNPDSKNYCTFKKIIPLLPNKNVLYFDIGQITHSDTNPLQKKFHLLASQNLSLFEPFSQEIPSSSHPNKYNVSPIDFHPSALANQIIAKLFYQEITTNPEWGFVK